MRQTRLSKPPSKKKWVRVGHSPDPDDAFMFYALAKEKIPMRGFRVQHVIEDIESLNQRALRGELEVTAVSCHAYPYLADRYLVMSSGASVGDQYGPILVAKKGTISLPSPQPSPEGRGGPLSISSPLRGEGRVRGFVHGKKVAVPGKLTTAYLVLQLYEKEFEPVFIPFDQIFKAVQQGKADLGLVIHEGQITFSEEGLAKILDLGGWWHQKTKLPLPLGIDIIRRDLGEETIRAFAGLFKESIQYALDHRQEALKYALQFGRGISPKLGDRFVGMYVNDYTVELGPQGMAGFERLLHEGYEKGILPRKIVPEYITL